MKLRYRFVIYLIFIHLLFGGAAAYLLFDHRYWLIVLEVLCAASLIFGLTLNRYLFRTLDFIRSGEEFIKESDYGSRFREMGQPDVDRAIRLYNRMMDQLQQERIKLQEQQYFLEKIVEASPSGIITLDFGGRITTVNPTASRMLQKERSELIGKKLTEIGISFADGLNNLKAGHSEVLPLLGRRRVKCRKSQYMDRGFPRDFILMDELTEELRQSEKAAYEKLIRVMSHEVNNSVAAANSLLHSCLNYAGQLNEEDRKDFEAALSVVIARTEQLNRFMRNFADVVRLPSPVPETCDMQKLLENIYLLVEPEISRRKIRWEWDAREKLPPVRLDPSQMELVFVNIIKNAMEAIGNGGKITIRTGKESRRGFVTIEDTGPGIPADVRDKLFTPFFSTKANGQGIGLTLVQDILDQHQFDFSLDSAPATPTRFTIYFRKE